MRKGLINAFARKLFGASLRRLLREGRMSLPPRLSYPPCDARLVRRTVHVFGAQSIHLLICVAASFAPSDAACAGDGTRPSGNCISDILSSFARKRSGTRVTR